LYLSWGADTIVGDVSVITTRTGVHGGDEHEGTRILHIVFGAANGNLSVFQRLTKYFKHGSTQFRNLI
jgi:hypothetical protein